MPEPKVCYEVLPVVVDGIRPPSAIEAVAEPSLSERVTTAGRAALQWIIRGSFSLSMSAVGIISLGYYFYAYINDIWHQPIILSGLILSISTDGLMLLMNILQPRTKHKTLSFDPTKLTVLITCYNSEKVLAETLRQALHHVPPRQIIVVSDASTDRTEAIARSFGVNVFVNKENINKGLSINQVIDKVRTPYVLILDDDTRIRNTFIPTNLLDEGWAAVAFRVLPEPQQTLVNQFQQFEYRKTMVLGKESRAAMGAVSNISGAIGLYRTALLREQASHHSGQYGGEDQQRTLFTHLQSDVRGVTYVESTAYTVVPNSWRALARQRSLRWSRSTQENFFLCWYILASGHTPFVLKIDKTLHLFILLTDPLRILLWWLIFFHPIHLLTLYTFYLMLNAIAWRSSRQTISFWIVFLAPIYGFFKCLCRFVAHFYWFKVKYDYLVKRQFHHFVRDRNLLFEYATVTLVLILLWGVAIDRFISVTGSL